MNLNLRQIASKLSTRGWLLVGGSVLAGVVFIFLMMSMASKPSYTTIMAGQSPAQAGKATTALSAAGIPYQLENGGTAVAVETSQEGQARDLLDEQGLLSGTGGSSLDQLLGNQSLGESNFQQEEQETSALEQQLEQTIEGMNGINSAQVLLNIPDQTSNLFTGSNAQPSASVLINDDQSLGSTAVKAIASTVAGAVPGLSTSKVTISDQDGDLLWPTSGTGSALTAKESAQQAYDNQMAEQVNAELAATLGAGKAVVAVNATLNTDQETVDSVTYGKGKAPALTQSTTTENLTGNPAAASAAGNTATNNAASYAGTNGSGTTKYTNKSSNGTYGVNKTVTQKVIAPGSVTRQTVSVLLNSSVPATELPSIQSAVENAVGYVPGRDTISVSTVPFAKVAAAKTASSTKPLSDLKYVVVGLGSLIFLLFLGRMLRKRETENFAGRPTWLRELEFPRPLSELEAQTQIVDLEPPAVVARLRSPVNLARQQVEELVDRDPERVAAQIRQWMTED